MVEYPRGDEKVIRRQEVMDKKELDCISRIDATEAAGGVKVV